MMARMKQISADTNKIRKKHTRIAGDINKHIEWRKGKSGFPKTLPLKSVSEYMADIRTLTYSKDCGVKLNSVALHTYEQCKNLYLKIRATHESCKMIMPQSIEYFPDKTQRLSEIRKNLQEETDYVKKLAALTPEDLH